MMIRDVLVNLKMGEGPDVATDFAVSLAAELDAHLTGVAVTYAISIPPVYTEAFSTEFIDVQRQESQKLADAAVMRFTEAARSMGLTGEVRQIDGSLGGAAEEVGVMARLYDLTVVGQPDRDQIGSDEVVTEAVLFDSGRPVLLVPRNQQKPFSARRIMVAWDGGRTAARAVAEARPFLPQASFVEAVVVQARSKADEVPGADLARHLARHDKHVELRRLAPEGSESVADCILKEAVAREIDLIVMGGYGHSRLREFVLGGVTRDMLDKATIPVLFSH
ncbi:universal stress protein [Ancylobacter sp. 6x-1]|uniref:Universal stress protein n=1 Tax=Ancylobacter crimeensis TaxID=2579147 RepID=A0ABT0D8X1_9HYPH|nr:universal stress protein [Ancylobacter crimeensis]MCK0196401.1 universal stress protein [Ancylobacter crimeensis]